MKKIISLKWTKLSTLLTQISMSGTHITSDTHQINMRKSICIIFLILFTFSDTTAKAADILSENWANWSRYKSANEQLPLPQPYENRVVFMGNSITDSWDDWGNRPIFFSGSYINRGISGQVTLQMLMRFKQDVLDLKPKVVVILAGTNDIAGNMGITNTDRIANNLSYMCDIAVAHGIKVVLCSVLPTNKYPWAPAKNPAIEIPKLNEWIKNYAMANNHTFVDFFTPMATSDNGLKPEYSLSDGVHPNLSGYIFMEPLVEEGIKKALNGASEKKITQNSMETYGGKGIININSNQMESIEIYNTEGVLTRKLLIDSGAQKIPAEPGVYLVKSTNSTGTKVIVE